MKKGRMEDMRTEGEEEERGRGPHKRIRMGEVEEGLSDIGFAFEEIRSSMASPLENNMLSTAAFISVSNLLLLVLDKIGPVMMVMRQDIKQNIERLEDFFVLDPSLYSNVLEILRKEMREGIARKPQSCSRAVVWLTRSIDFSMFFMERLMKDPELSLKQAVEEAYDVTFKPWHGWISSAAYKVALKLIPDRTSFINLLVDKKQEQNLFEKDIQNLFSLLQPVLDEMHNHLRELKLEKLKSN